MRSRNNLGADYAEVKYETKSEKGSITQPNMTLPLRVMIERFASGQEVSGFNPVYQYSGTESIDNIHHFPDLEKLSKIERLELKKELETTIEDIQGTLSKRKKFIKEIEKKNIVEEDVDDIRIGEEEDTK